MRLHGLMVFAVIGCGGGGDPVDEVTLKVMITPLMTGGGTITSDPPLTCNGAECVGTFPAGTTVVLTPVPDAASVFFDWSDRCQTEVCEITLVDNTTIGAAFSWPSLQVDKDRLEGDGRISRAGGTFECPTDVDFCSTYAPRGSTVQVMLAPFPGSVVHSWTDAACGSATTCSVVMGSTFENSLGVRFASDPRDNGSTTFTATKEGSPLWEPAGFQGASVYRAEAFTANLIRFWDRHSYNAAFNAFFPGTPHASGYATEVADRMTMLGWNPGNAFKVADWARGNGFGAGRLIVWAGVVIPSAGAPMGSTDDYALGPYIPRDLSLFVDADLYLDTTIVDPDFDGAYPTLSQLSSTTVAGSSHLTLGFSEGQKFIPGVAGNYRLHIHIYEQFTPVNGWQIDIPFVVEP